MITFVCIADLWKWQCSRPLDCFQFTHVGARPTWQPNYVAILELQTEFEVNFEVVIMGKDKKGKKRSTGLTEDILESKNVRPSGRTKQRKDRQGESEDTVRSDMFGLIVKFGSPFSESTVNFDYLTYRWKVFLLHF